MFPLIGAGGILTSVSPAGPDVVASGVRRVESMVRSIDFVMWPDCTYAPWDREVSLYAAHFLVEAEKNGYALNRLARDRVFSFLKRWAMSTNDTVSAYACHTLALAGSPEKDRMLRLYDAAIRCADHLDSVFGPPPKRTWLNGHPGLEYALCRLADSVNATEGAGKGEKYARLARHFIRNQYRAEGDNGKWRKDYHQADLPAWEMKDAAGHAVRAVYFYSAMSALASRLGDEELGTAADRLFDSAINRKEYLTGGVGAAWHGEAFAGDYELGNNGYCESCASCGMSFWTIEQHRRKPGTWPVDVQERLVYNNLLGAISEDGEKFFYQNPLDSDKQRYPWHKCPCCVGNVPRTLFALKDNAYSVSGDGRTLYADHFLTLEGAVGKVAGVEMSIRQQTGYPWDGKTSFISQSASMLAKKGIIMVFIKQRS